MKNKHTYRKSHNLSRQKKSRKPSLCSKLEKLGLIIYSLKYPLVSVSYILSLLFRTVFPVGYAALVYSGMIRFDIWHLGVGLLLIIYLAVEKWLNNSVERMFWKKKPAR
jgi:hypothetical protein